MKSMKNTSYFVFLLFLYSCSNEKLGDKNNNVELIEAKDPINLTISSFTTLPSDIDGCGCYFYLSEQDEKNNNYVFVNDFAKTAFICINDSLQKFELIKHKDNSDFYDYKNLIYDLKIEILKKENEGEEGSRIEGRIKLSKGKLIIEKEFRGTCGC